MAPRRSGSLLLRLPPAQTGMLRFLLESEENLGIATTLDRREALLRLIFSPDDEPRVRRWLARAAQDLEFEILPWPKGFKEEHFSAKTSWAASPKPEGASAMASLKYRRALLKLSGESLAGSHKTGIDPGAVAEICEEIGQVLEMGVEMALVIGGGNIFRGLSASARGMERSSADYMGMLATVLNALAVQDMLEKLGHPTRVLSAINMREVCEPFVRRRALRHLEKHRVVICAGGTGNPYFTTDTTAALRGMELKCDVIIKATRVDGIYDRDPEKDPCAVKYASLTYEEALGRHLGIMDATAFALLRENNVPIIVCRMFGGDIRRALLGEDVGTLVSGQAAHT